MSFDAHQHAYRNATNRMNTCNVSPKKTCVGCNKNQSEAQFYNEKKVPVFKWCKKCRGG